ncbi:MAG: hypothetical protein IOC49_12120 [Methylobacterium sp.]|nr:hypothetical protein [Methylobacterium sp.]
MNKGSEPIGRSEAAPNATKNRLARVAAVVVMQGAMAGTRGSQVPLSIPATKTRRNTERQGLPQAMGKPTGAFFRSNGYRLIEENPIDHKNTERSISFIQIGNRSRA